MKILIVGSDRVWAIERFYHHYLNELGVQTEFFLAQSMFYDYYQKSIVNKIIFKLGLSGVFRKINKLFKVFTKTFAPEIILIFKGMEVLPDSIRWAKKRGIKVIGYNPDNPFLFSGKGSGNKNVTESVALYNLHLTYNKSIQKEIKDVYGLPVAFLPFGFDLKEELFKECVKDKEIIKACFLGNPDKERAAFILEVAKSGIQIDVYGNDWRKFVKHQNISIFAPIYGDEFWRTLRRYRVQLNLMRPHNPDSHNMRSFEVPGVGGILLAPDTVEHRDFFEPGEEIFLFTDLQNCIEKLKYLLNLTSFEADKIRENARNRSISSKYTYKDRAFQLLQIIKSFHLNTNE